MASGESCPFVAGIKLPVQSAKRRIKIAHFLSFEKTITKNSKRKEKIPNRALQIFP